MTFTAAFPFCGLGGGALGFQNAGFRTIGAWDIDADAARDFELLTGNPCTVADLGSCDPDLLRDTCDGFPDVVFLSPPCKSFSGCLPAAKSRTAKYRDLSDLSLRGVWLCLEAWAARPPKVFLLENVPRITTRGRQWLDHVVALLQSYGYAVKETVHDCGALGGLAQRRRRFLLVARHMEQVPEFLYEPPKRPVLAIRDVLGELPCPVPGSDAGGPMHRLPRLSAMNWLRLALIPAGGDWRDLPPEVALVPRAGRQNDWTAPGHAVVAEGSVRNTWASTNDPRMGCEPRKGVMGVAPLGQPAGTVVGAARHDNGTWSIEDPRVTCHHREGSLGVTGWGERSTSVIANRTHHNGPWQVADPRLEHTPGKSGRYGVEDGDAPSHTVTSARVGSGWATAVTDPRLDYTPRRGTMGVHAWAEASHAIIGDARTNKGANIADQRVPVCVGPELDLDAKRPLWLVIRAADGTWHRPMTTLELAALQGFPTMLGDEWLVLDGTSHGAWRGRIGNAVPPPTAEAIARSMLRTLGAAKAGGLMLSSDPVWVTPRRSVEVPPCR